MTGEWSGDGILALVLNCLPPGVLSQGAGVLGINQTTNALHLSNSLFSVIRPLILLPPASLPST